MEYSGESNKDALFRSHGWNVISVSGTDVCNQLVAALKMTQTSGSPTVILVDTGYE